MPAPECSHSLRIWTAPQDRHNGSMIHTPDRMNLIPVGLAARNNALMPAILNVTGMYNAASMTACNEE